MSNERDYQDLPPLVEHAARALHRRGWQHADAWDAAQEAAVRVVAGGKACPTSLQRSAEDRAVDYLEQRHRHTPPSAEVTFDAEPARQIRRRNFLASSLTTPVCGLPDVSTLAALFRSDGPETFARVLRRCGRGELIRAAKALVRLDSNCRRDPDWLSLVESTGYRLVDAQEPNLARRLVEAFGGSTTTLREHARLLHLKGRIAISEFAFGKAYTLYSQANLTGCEAGLVPGRDIAMALGGQGEIEGAIDLLEKLVRDASLRTLGVELQRTGDRLARWRLVLAARKPSTRRVALKRAGEVEERWADYRDPLHKVQAGIVVGEYKAAEGKITHAVEQFESVYNTARRRGFVHELREIENRMPEWLGPEIALPNLAKWRNRRGRSQARGGS